LQVGPTVLRSGVARGEDVQFWAALHA